jgi:hypothetical protein
MPIASSGRWTTLTVEWLKLDRKHGAGDGWPRLFTPLQATPKWGAILNESNRAARSDDAGGLR